MKIGILAEGVLLSLALADRVNLLAQEKQLLEKKSILHNQITNIRLIHAQETERETVSDAMHASIGHSLLFLKQQISQLHKSCDSDNPPSIENIKLALDEKSIFCSKILDDVRDLSQDLYPHMLKYLGLKQAIEITIQKAFSNSSIEWQSDIDEITSQLDQERSITIYRAIQESIDSLLARNNITEIIFSIKSVNNEIVINIKDDGDANFEHLEIQKKYEECISHIRGRIELFNGYFELRFFQTGSHLRFSVPFST
jgi:signal transduction histidine kinase